MNVTHRGRLYRVENEQDIQTLIVWVRLLTSVGSLARLMSVPAARVA